LALKIKHHGRVPVRPPGVGYDSEAEEAEEDPAIESQFILRMQPGPDCDLLRKAIEEKKIGKPSAEGGTMVVFRFFDGEGRRAIISIQNRLYAAAMVDLPCVIESMKSWNKKDWVKTADVCQMLLVLGRVANEEEAKRYPLPQEVHPHKHQYPHGLTPPMHWVRRRRFRPRQSYHEIEQRETMVNKLLAEDESARTSGGSTEYEIIDENKPESDMGSSDEDAEGEEEDIAETTEYLLEGETPGGEEIEVDNNELAAALAAGLMEDEVDVDALFGGEEGEPETPLTSHDVAVHALGENAVSTPETAVTSPNAATSPDDDDDDDDDAESAQEDEIDAQAVAAQEGLEQGMTEIRELEQEIAKAQEQLDSSNNVLYKQRCKRKIEQLQTDLGLKKAALGIGDDGD
jgi:transcription initiation factor TFIID subunit 7